MADLEIDFQYAPALGALKNSSRRRLMSAPRTAKLSDYAHRERSFANTDLKLKLLGNIRPCRADEHVPIFAQPASVLEIKFVNKSSGVCITPVKNQHPKTLKTWIPGRASYRQLARNDGQILPCLVDTSSFAVPLRSKTFPTPFPSRPTSKPIARAPSRVAMPIINISKVSRGGGSLG